VLNVCGGSYRTKKYETVLPAHLRSYKFFKKLQASQILERFKKLSYSTQYWKRLPVVQSNLPPPATCSESDGSHISSGKCDSFQDNLEA